MPYELSGTPEQPPTYTHEKSTHHGLSEPFAITPGAPVEPTPLTASEQSALDAVPEALDSNDTRYNDRFAECLITDPPHDILPLDSKVWALKDARHAEQIATAMRHAPIIGKHMLIGGGALADPYRQEIVAQINRLAQWEKYPSVVEPTLEDRKVRNRIVAGAASLGERLGANTIFEELPTYLFDTNQSLNDVLSLVTKPGAVEAAGFYVPAKGIFVSRERGSGSFARVLGHEVVHAASLHQHLITESSEPERLLGIHDTCGVGYRRADVVADAQHSGFDESVVQLAAIHISKEAGVDDPYRYAHRGNDILLDSIIKVTAKKHNASPAEIDDLLVKGLFNGDLSGAQLVREALGPERWKHYASLGSLQSWQAIPIARALGLDAAADIASQTHFDGKFRIYDWLR